MKEKLKEKYTTLVGCVQWDKVFTLLVGLLVLSRFLLYCRTSVSAYSDSYFDDQLLHDFAKTIIDGQWLGDYDYRTLSKGISYELFIAISYWIGIPYTFALGILNISAGIIFIKALSPIIKNKYVRGLGLLFLVWNPVMLDGYISRRLYRNALVPGLVLLVFGFMIGAYLRREKSWKKTWVWYLGEGAALAFFYQLREDSIWIMPAVVVVIIIEVLTILFSLRNKHITRGEACGKTVWSFMPVIMVFLFMQCICACNFYNYGLWITNDRMNTAFADVVEDLYSIKDDQEGSVVWISKDAIEQAMEASPTLAEDRGTIEYLFDGWSTPGYDEVVGDISVWVLRMAIWNEEEFNDATELESFCEKVHSELQTAFDNGQLERDGKIHLVSGIEGTSAEELISVMKKTVSNMIMLSGYEYLDVGSGSSTGEVNLSVDTGDMLGSIVNLDGYTGYTGTHTYCGITERRGQTSIKIYNKIENISRIVLLIASFLMLVNAVINIRRKKWTKYQDLFLAFIGIILSAFVLEFGQLMAMRFQTDEGVIQVCTHLYSAGVYEMCDMLYAIGYMVFFSFLIKKICEYKNKN